MSRTEKTFATAYVASNETLASQWQGKGPRATVATERTRLALDAVVKADRRNFTFQIFAIGIAFAVGVAIVAFVL